MNIIVDAFGGDNAPLEVIKGCKIAEENLGTNIILTGDKEIIKKTAGENDISQRQYLKAEKILLLQSVLKH